MPEKIPQSLKAEHEALRATLKRAMREPGKTGEAARKLAAIVDGHFLREEKFVLPLLGMLPALAKGDTSSSLAKAPTLLTGLRGEIGRMITDHREITDVLHTLAQAAENEGKGDYVGFVEDLIVYTHVAEEVYYPAALVAGEYVKKLRGK